MKRVLLIALAMVLLSASAMADAAFDLVVQMLDESDTEEYTVTCQYNNDSDTVFYIVDLVDTALEFAVKNGSDADVRTYRQTTNQLANAVKSAFDVTDNPDVNISVAIYSHDDQLIIVSTPELTAYQGAFAPWNDRSADYLENS